MTELEKRREALVSAFLLKAEKAIRQVLVTEPLLAEADAIDLNVPVGLWLSANEMEKVRQSANEEISDARRASALWSLLDDISTLDDAARNDDAGYRRIARQIAEKRHAVAYHDGRFLRRVTDHTELPG